MSPRARRAIGLATAVGHLAWVAPGLAQTAPSPAQTAPRAPAQAQAADVGSLYDQARVFQAKGDYPAAVDALVRFQVEAPREWLSKRRAASDLMAELRAHVAALQIACDTPGADVTVRGRAVGKTPLDGALRVNSGPATITVTLPGFVPFRKDVDLAGGNTTWLDVTLENAERRGTLAVRVSGNGALVTIDGRPAGVTPLEVSLAPGSHAVVVHREGSYDVTATTVVVAGQKKELRYDLSGPISISLPWWGWTLIGLGVAVAAGVTYAAFAEKNHTEGDHFSPGVASEPLVKW